ncbi:MAG: hypothetical protein AABP62_10470 [Planctomycetota bacterium]
MTNNTLQLLARIYDYSPMVASNVLSDITGESIELGIEIHQQKPGVKSVPDGTIIQRSFKILLEAKVEAAYDAHQLEQHAKTFTNESQKLLLLLTKEPLEKEELESIRRRLRKVSHDIIFKNITYEGICDLVKDRFKEHEATMCALVQDYIEYCNDANLTDQSKFLMRIVPCGVSIEINRKYGIYFQRSDRGYSRHAYVGVYAEKAVRLIWKIESVFDVTLQDNGKLLKELVQGEQTQKYDQQLRDIIKDAKTECDYQIASSHRFFCGNPLETDFKKTSSGGIYGARFINLREIVGDYSDVSDIANKLRSKVWK